MIAEINKWYSIQWQIQDYSKSKGFIELVDCPKFFFVEKYYPCLKLHLEEKYPHIYISKIFKTKIFIDDELPTHYDPLDMMPGDNPRYDNWLINYHKSTPDILDAIKQRQELNQTKIFLEYSNKILRHDLHSGINTYIPRGFNMLKKKLDDETISRLKLGAGMMLLEKGINHAQDVYRGVQSLTGMVRDFDEIETEPFNVEEALNAYLGRTHYFNKVEISPMGDTTANRALFCMAIDVFVKNGVVFNSSKDKKIKIYQEGRCICIEDNGVGLSQERFDIIVYPKNKEDRVPGFDSIEMNIATTILKEHGMKITIHEANPGTIIKIWDVFAK